MSWTPILRHRRTDRAHAVRQHVHRPAGHGAAEQLLQAPAHLKRVHPVVGRSRAVLGKRADKGPLFDPRDIVGIGPGVVTPRPEILIEPGERPARDQLGAQILVLFLGAIHPVNGSGLRELPHLVDPTAQMHIGRQRDRGIARKGGHDGQMISRQRHGELASRSSRLCRCAIAPVRR